MLKLICGTVVSARTEASALVGLPALSETDAVTVALPSLMPARSAAGTLSVQLPSACTCAVYCLPLNETVTVWPASAVVEPLRVKSCPASAALSILSLLMVLMLTVGAVVSTLNSCADDAALPFALVTLTCTLASPSFRPLRSAAGTVYVQSPLASTVVVQVLPAKVMVTV